MIGDAPYTDGPPDSPRGWDEWEDEREGLAGDLDKADDKLRDAVAALIDDPESEARADAVLDAADKVHAAAAALREHLNAEPGS